MLQCKAGLGRGRYGRLLLSTAHGSLSKYLHKDKVEQLKPNSWLDIQFPFPQRWAPKGFDSEIEVTNTLKFLLTEQRLKLLLEVHQLTTLSNRRSGLVLAGPHGLGKSAVILDNSESLQSNLFFKF
jgi:hypothetical protein